MNAGIGLFAVLKSSTFNRSYINVSLANQMQDQNGTTAAGNNVKEVRDDGT